jgi:uncharacterized membrane protein
VPASALGLALAAAVAHAAWNLLLGRARDVEAATAVALAAGVVLFAPVAVIGWDVQAAAAPYIATSAVLELAYLALLARSYRDGEVSVIYPVSRGSAPVIVLIGGVAVLGAGTSAMEVAGVAMVGAGVLLVRGLRGDAAPRDLLAGLAIGVLIAGYTLTDSEGLDHASPIPYLALVLAMPAGAYLAAMARVKGTTALRAEVRWLTIVTGTLIFGSYVLVLAALELAPAAPVAAVRETSVVIAVALAAAVLGERVTVERLAGAVVVAAGVGAVALG